MKNVNRERSGTVNCNIFESKVPLLHNDDDDCSSSAHVLFIRHYFDIWATFEVKIMRCHGLLLLSTKKLVALIFKQNFMQKRWYKIIHNTFLSNFRINFVTFFGFQMYMLHHLFHVILIKINLNKLLRFWLK